MFLLKDPLFLAAIGAFIVGLIAFLWSIARLRSSAPASRGVAPPEPAPATDKEKLWTFPPPPGQPPDSESTVKMSAVSFPSIPKEPSATGTPAFSPPGPTAKENADALQKIVEEKFSDMSKRLSSLEHPKAGQAPAYLDPLLKRVQEMEGELKNLKFAFTQLASAQNAVNMSDITAKIQGIQKILENLTSGTDVSKPS